MKHLVTSMVLTAGLAAVSVVAPPAHALEFVAAGSSACTGATWSDERALLKAPQALSNESNQPVLVTCSVPTYALQLPPNNSFTAVGVISLANPSTKLVAVTCQAFPVNALRPDDFDTHPVTFTIRPRDIGGWSFAIAQERNAATSFALSCTLPPHVAVQSIVGRVIEWQTGPME